MLEEKEFKAMTDQIYHDVYEAFADFDPDEVEADFNLDNVSITFADGVKFIINRQTPVRQIWLATKRQGLHFDYHQATQTWVSDKTGEEFFAVFNREVSAKLGQEFKVETTAP